MASCLACIVALLILAPIASAGEEVVPLPLPKTIRVQSAGPRGKIWDSLSTNDKQLVYHLTEAANAGRALLYHQSHRRSLAIKHFLEEAL